MNNLKPCVILFICLLTACAPPRQSIELSENKLIPTAQGKEQAKAIPSWEIRGAMAAKNKSKGWSAAMNWIQNGPNSYQIRLMGPLGSGTVLIDKQGNTITFQDGPKKIIAHDAEELLLKQTGIKLPVNNLYYWIRGLAAPGAIAAEHHDQNNHLAQLKQNGYTINFTQYMQVRGSGST